MTEATGRALNSTNTVCLPHWALELELGHKDKQGSSKGDSPRRHGMKGGSSKYYREPTALSSIGMEIKRFFFLKEYKELCPQKL